VAFSDNRVDQALWALGPGGTEPSLARAKWDEGLKPDRTSPWSYKGRYNQQSKASTNESRMGDNINIYNVAMDGRLINVMFSFHRFHHYYHQGILASFSSAFNVFTFLYTAVAISRPLSLISFSHLSDQTCSASQKKIALVSSRIV
jgi:hypothetical protein